MLLLYNIGIWCYGRVIALAALRSEKAKLWVEGRKNRSAKGPQKKTGKRYWFHCASLGEFEQARPLIEYYHGQGISICITFFSPSGYEIRKDYALAEWTGYLPLDTASNAKAFVKQMDADKVFFVKYEFWYHHLMAIRQTGVGFYLISALFRGSQPFFKWYGGMYRKMLDAYTHIFTQDEGSVILLQSIGYSRVMKSGDTRFDRVAEFPKQREKLPLIESFVGNAPVLVAGSCWEPEEKIIRAAVDEFPEMKWILVPHDVSEAHIRPLQLLFSGISVLYSAVEAGAVHSQASVLIVDKIGLLGNIYPYGNVAFVGGGFQNSLHNILEAATWGIPVFYGDDTAKYPEGACLVQEGGGVAVANEVEFIQQLKSVLIEGPEKRGALAKKWIENNAGATRTVIEQTAISD